MGLEIARRVGVILIARAKGNHFLVYHGADAINFDAVPQQHKIKRAGSFVEHAKG
jgi:FdhD protein